MYGFGRLGKVYGFGSGASDHARRQWRVPGQIRRLAASEIGSAKCMVFLGSAKCMVLLGSAKCG